MNEPFGKFYAKTFTGSMMGAGSHVIAVLAFAVSNARPPDGTVELNPRFLSAVIGDSEERMQAAIEFLCSEDPRSRSPEENGRRLSKQGQFSYRLVNWSKYRDGTDMESRRKYFRDKQAERRKRLSNSMSKTVFDCRETITQAEAEAEAIDTKRESKSLDVAASAHAPSWEEFWEYVKMHHGTPEWFARDKFLAAQQKNWRDCPNWTAYAARMHAWWQNDGSKMAPEKKMSPEEKREKEQRLKAVMQEIREIRI